MTTDDHELIDEVLALLGVPKAQHGYATETAGISTAAAVQQPRRKVS